MTSVTTSGCFLVPRMGGQPIKGIKGGDGRPIQSEAVYDVTAACVGIRAGTRVRVAYTRDTSGHPVIRITHEQEGDHKELLVCNAQMKSVKTGQTRRIGDFARRVQIDVNKLLEAIISNSPFERKMKRRRY